MKLKPWVNKMSSFPLQEMLYIALRLILALVVQKGESSHYWINHYLMDNLLTRFGSTLGTHVGPARTDTREMGQSAQIR